MKYVGRNGRFTLILSEDPYPENPREYMDHFGRMIGFHPRYQLGDEHSYSKPEDFLRELLFQEYTGDPQYVLDYVKSGKADGVKLAYSHSRREWELLVNQSWSSENDYFPESSYPGGLKGKDIPGWYLEDTLSRLGVKDLERLALDSDRIVILPLYLYDHSGITMNTTGFSCPWDSGQVGWTYATKESILREFGGNELNTEKRARAKTLLVGEVDSYDHFLRGDVWQARIFEGGEEIESIGGIEGPVESVISDVGGYYFNEKQYEGLTDNLEEVGDGVPIKELLQPAFAGTSKRESVRSQDVPAR